MATAHCPNDLTRGLSSCASGTPIQPGAPEPTAAAAARHRARHRVSRTATHVTAPLGTVAWRVYAQIFVENLVFVTIISLAMAFTQVGATGMLDAWRATYLWLVLIGYVTSVCLYLVFHPREA